MIGLLVALFLLFVFFSNPSGCVASILMFMLFCAVFLTPFWPFAIALLVLYVVVRGIFDKDL